MDLNIRPATASDAERLQVYAERLFSEDLPGIFRRPIPTVDDEVEFIHSRTSQPNGTLLVAEASGRIVGLVDLVGAQMAEEAHAATFGISVDQDFRGRGVGGALLEAIVSWARQHEITRIQGFVWNTNPRALKLYERLGFEREGVCRRAVMRDGEPVDVVLVARLLDA